MSISYCHKHGVHHDTDFDVECPACESEPQSHSILSAEPDGMGFYYGHAPGDFRQINIKPTFVNETDLAIKWEVYVAGDLIGHAETKAQAETKALLWCSANPEAL